MKYVLALLILLILAAPASALVRITYSWSPPSMGTPWEYFVCQTRWFGGDWSECTGVSTDTMLTVETFNGVLDFQLRTASVDSVGRQGTWGEPSNPYNDLGPPGPPGKPRIEQVIHIIED